VAPKGRNAAVGLRNGPLKEVTFWSRRPDVDKPEPNSMLGVDFTDATFREVEFHLLDLAGMTLLLAVRDNDLNAAAYTVSPTSDGGTEVRYDLAIELVVPLPGFVKRRAEVRILNTLRELKTRAEVGVTA